MAVAADVERLARAAQELERRVETCRIDLALMRDQRERLLGAVAEGQRLMDDDVAVLRDCATTCARLMRRRPTCERVLSSKTR